MGKRKTKAQKRKRKIIIVVVELVVLLLVLAALYVFMKFSKINREDIGEIETNELDADTLDRLSGYTDLVIFGVDNRANGNTDSGNSDMIMLASINNDTDEVKLVSVYRDTYLNQTDDSYNKANYAYQKGGAERALRMLNMNLDLDIEDYVTVDFKAVSDVVDAVGGVEIDVSAEELEYLNMYATETADITGKSYEWINEPGIMTLNGVEAVAYSRIRYVGDDYARTERQREVVGQIVEKAKQSDLKTLNAVADSLFPEISTSLSMSQMLQLISQVFSYDLGETTGFPFELTTKNIHCGDTIIPIDLEQNVSELHEFLYETEEYTPSETVKKCSDYIKDFTGITAESGE